MFKILVLLSGYVTTNLFITKSRISPMKNVTISRLILLGKLIQSRLMDEVKIAIKKEVEIGDVSTGLMIHTFIYHG